MAEHTSFNSFLELETKEVFMVPASLTEKKDHEDEVLLYENMLNFVLKCAKHHNYAESQMATCAL